MLAAYAVANPAMQGARKFSMIASSKTVDGCQGGGLKIRPPFAPKLVTNPCSPPVGLRGVFSVVPVVVAIPGGGLDLAVCACTSYSWLCRQP